MCREYYSFRPDSVVVGKVCIASQLLSAICSVSCSVKRRAIMLNKVLAIGIRACR